HDVVGATAHDGAAGDPARLHHLLAAAAQDRARRYAAGFDVLRATTTQSRGAGRAVDVFAAPGPHSRAAGGAARRHDLDAAAAHDGCAGDAPRKNHLLPGTEYGAEQQRAGRHAAGLDILHATAYHERAVGRTGDVLAPAAEHLCVAGCTARPYDVVA